MALASRVGDGWTRAELLNDAGVANERSDPERTVQLFGESLDLRRELGGEFDIADSLNNRVRKVDTNGIITTFAGNGGESTPFFWGDGGLAVDGAPGLEEQVEDPESGLDAHPLRLRNRC